MEVASEEELLNLQFSSLEIEMRSYAREHHVPIIQDAGLAFLELMIRTFKPKRILEIGTAIGYSAIRMQQVCASNIITIERDEKMAQEAVQNIMKAGMEEKIKIIFKDALLAYEDLQKETFDMIFIDAAKAQYQKFFSLYTPLLNPNGVVICDNMSFHGLVSQTDAYAMQSRSVRGLIRKLSAFSKSLLENEDFITTILPIGDGMAVAIKR